MVLRRAVLVALLGVACITRQDLGVADRCALDAAPCDVTADAAPRCRRPDETRPCYDGAPGTLAVGRCRAGVQRCDPLAGRFAGACEGAERPSPIELCGNRIDDDCDGATDEDCGADRIFDVAVGDRVSCALAREDGRAKVACWGDGASGIFGGARGPRLRPEALGAPIDTSGIVMGAAHLCALASGRVWCVGSNASGALGDGTLVDRATFARVAGLDGVRAVAAGRWHTCAVAGDGGVWCWGSDRVGQTGAASGGAGACASGMARGCHPTPRRVSLPAAARALTAGFEHTCATLDDGAAWCWGASSAFRADATMEATSPTPVADGVEALRAGASSTCWWRGDARCVGRLAALEMPWSDGPAQTWGGWRWCAVRDGAWLRCTNDGWWPSLERPGDEARPLALVDVARAQEPIGVVAVSVSHACAVWGGRAVRCWGDSNAWGQLGVGSTAAWATPTMDVAW